MVPFLVAGSVIVAAIVLVVLLTRDGEGSGGDCAGGEGCGGDVGGGSSGDLEAAVERFVEADDCAALADATSESWQQDYMDRNELPDGAEPAETFVDFCQVMRDAGDAPIANGQDELQSAEVVSQEAGTAVVRATSLVGGQELDVGYMLVDEGGAWKVDRLVDPGELEAGGESGGAEAPADPEGGAGGSGAGGGLPEGAREDPDAPGGLAAEPDANGNLPEDVVATFYEAVNNADCELLRENVTTEAWLRFTGVTSEDEAMDACLSQPGPSETVVVESSEFDGILLEPSAEDQAEGMLPATAIVTVVTNREGEREMWLVMEDGRWKVY